MTAKSKIEEIQEKIKKDHSEEIPEAPKAVKTEEVKQEVPKVEEKEPEAAIEKVEPAQIDPKSGQLLLTPKHLQLIKDQIAKNSTKEEFEMFLMMAYRTRLDPLMKQLYFIKYDKKDRNGKIVGANVSYVTSIDGYRIIASRTGEFCGVDEPRFEYDKNGRLTHCAVTVYRFVQGQRVGFSAKVKFSEYSTNKNLWTDKPETMIAKVAEAHALRKAFPNDLSGIYTQDEMDQAEASKSSSAPAAMINKVQAQRITALMAQKGVTEKAMRDWVFKVYKTATMKNLRLEQAAKIIQKLEAMPDAVNPLDAEPEEKEGFDRLADEAIQDGEVMPDVLVDEIAAGIEAQRAEKGAHDGETIH